MRTRTSNKRRAFAGAGHGARCVRIEAGSWAWAHDIFERALIVVYNGSIQPLPGNAGERTRSGFIGADKSGARSLLRSPGSRDIPARTTRCL